MKVTIQKLLITALCKISSAIDDIHEIEDEKMFKGNVKRDINTFIKWYDDYSSPVSSIYYENNAKFFETVVEQFNNYENALTLPRKADNRMCLFNCKLRTVILDFEMMDFEDDNDVYYFMKILAEKISILLTKGFWNQYTMQNYEDISELTANMTRFGKKIYTEENEQV